jgi:hypothetical protein
MMRRLIGSFALALFGLMFLAGPATADPSPVTSPIQAGADQQTVGSATFTRTANSDGTETLTVDLSVPGGIDEDHLCLSSSPFTARIAPGQCAYSHENLGGATADQYVINVGTAYIGKTIYAQLHVATSGGDTAYAGWQPGKPFYGNVAIDPLPVAGVPAAPLLGTWMPAGLGALFVAGAGTVVWRQRRRVNASGDVAGRSPSQ